MTGSVIVRRAIDEGNDLDTLNPLLRRIYSARNISKLDELSSELAGLISFNLLLNIEKATERLAKAIFENQNILIVGDFDVDGATSSALAVSALHAMGAKQVSYLVPNRFTYGYGLTAEIVEVASEQKPDLIVTVDNGISSHAGIDRANELGIDVLITDHHLPGATLPKAYTIVNPNQPGDEFPSKNLAGVGVIFYVMLALRSYLNSKQWFSEQQIPCPKMSRYLDLVALGTVADVVPLDKNNRIMVSQGLRRIRAGFTCYGISALLQVAGRKPDSLKAMDLGYSVGPRLNAAGRLVDMSIGISCLLADNLSAALTLARKLDDLNKDRRVIETKMKQEAFDAIDELNLSGELPDGLCVYEEHWHQGVVGLVAARVKERVHRPVIAFAKVDDETLKGSARSITGLHIRDVLEAIATNHPELISKFGGHAMAAGLSLDAKNYKAFTAEFEKEVSLRVNKDDLHGKYETDGELTTEELNLETAEMLTDAGPWGQGFPEPIFDGKFNLISQRVVGSRHLKLVLQAPDTDHYVDAILFNADLDEWPNHNCRSIVTVYRMDVNEFNDRRRLQLIIEHIQPG